MKNKLRRYLSAVVFELHLAAVVFANPAATPIIQKDIHQFTLSSLRHKFRNASILQESNQSFVINSTWRCWSKLAAFGDMDERFYDLKIIEKNGILRISYGLNQATANFRPLAFTPIGLSSTVGSADFSRDHDSYSINSIRYTQEGSLIIENATFNESRWNDQTHARALSYPNAFAGSYAICSHDAGSSHIAPGIPGGCLKNSDKFVTEGGGCYHFGSVKAFSMSPPWKSLTYFQAEKYCENLIEGGKKEWQLASEGDLLRAAPDAFEHFRFSIHKAYWGRSLGSTPNAPYVEVGTGRRAFGLKTNREAAVVCVHAVLDNDQDRIPDAIDICKNTPRGEIVNFDGFARGCSSTQASVLIPPPANQFVPSRTKLESAGPGEFKLESAQIPRAPVQQRPVPELKIPAAVPQEFGPPETNEGAKP